jgi:hypothetical protein
VITKFYHQDYINGYYEGRNSKLVMDDYHYADEGYVNHYLTYLKTTDAKETKIRFSTIDIGEDMAVATYRLIVTDADGEEWTGGYITQMIRDEGRWKLAFTKPSY